MLKNKQFMLAVLLLFMANLLQAQTRTITGRVTSANNEVQPGASVVIKETSKGTVTDANGKYTIVAPSGEVTLVISSIGFDKLERVVGSGVSVADITLAESAGNLSEVVVTALGISREKKTLVYATQTVKPAELIEARDPNNVLNSLQGKIANAVITQGSGGPGSGARIVLRGNKSLQGSNNALIVVDGVPITNGTNGSINSDFGGVNGSDGASSINPDDIESLTVLRGASAAALYGSQAGNGVIVITTKKGKKDKVSVSINSGVAFENPLILPSTQNEYGQGNSGTIKLDADGKSTSGESWGAKLDGQTIKAYNGESRKYSAEPNNVRDFFRTGLTLNNSVGISGGSEKMQTYLSYTNNNVQGIMPRNDMNRHTINLRLTNQVTKRFSTDAKVTYILQDIKSRYGAGESESAVMDAYLIPRNVSATDAKVYEVINNVGIGVPAPYPVTNKALYENPYWLVYNKENNENRNRIMSFLTAKYDLLSWLHLSARVNYDRTSDILTTTIKQGTLGVSPSGGGDLRKEVINVNQTWADLILDGNNKLSEDFKIDYRLGAIYKDNNYDYTSARAGGFSVTNFFSMNFATTPSTSQDASRLRNDAVFGQVNVGYKEAIFLDASLRNEWDSRLPKPYSFSYPSVGLSAVISDMTTMPTAISFLKLSANYAQVGNGGQNQIRFNTFNFSQGAGNGYITRSSTRAIPDLKPEIVTSFEYGFDVKFFKDRLGLQFSAYKSNSENQLLLVNLPVATGFENQYINAGNIQNKGIEIFLNATPVKNTNLTWDIGLNIGMNKNKIIKLSETITEFGLGGFGRSATPIIKVGGSYGDMVGLGWLRDANGKFRVTNAGVPIQTTDVQYIGSFNPKAQIGFSNTFNYKGLNLRVLVDGRIGGVIVDGTELLTSFNGIPEATAKYREGGWNLGGVNDKGEAVTATINAQQFWTTVTGGRYGAAEFYAYDATNFKLREISFGTKIPFPAGLGIKAARISLVGRNLLFIYRGSSKLDIPGLGKRKMSFDPDMSLGNQNWQGISYGTFPATRSMGLNLQITI